MMINVDVIYYSSFGIIVAAFILLFYNFMNLKAHKEGTKLMVERAAIIRSGAKTFLNREYRVIVPTAFIIALTYSLFREAWSGVCFLLAAVLSSFSVQIGMRGGAYGNVRTANAARKTRAMSRTVRIALMGGSTSGFSVPAFGFFGYLIVWLASGGANVNAQATSIIGGLVCNPVTMRLTAYSLGCSVIAMFNRVAGGNYTKAADIAADNVGKGRHHLVEDDPRNVCSIADLIGDLVNDIAGNVSDLKESLMATPTACVLIGFQVFKNDQELLTAACVFPIVLCMAGLLASLVSIMFIILKNRKRHKWVTMATSEYETKFANLDAGSRPAYREDESTPGFRNVWVEYSPEVDDPAKELNLATWISAAVVAVCGLYGSYLLFGNMVVESFRWGWISPWFCALLGIVSSVAVGMITEYYTSTKYKPVKELSETARDGVALMVTKGTSIGNQSVFPIVGVIGFSTLFSVIIGGSYGVAIAAVGMLSFVGTTVSIDAFGPIADNAGGIAESCGLDPEVREITDNIDAVGNTTAAVGKGNAIGSASFATEALAIAFLGAMSFVPDLSNPVTLVSIIVGIIFGMGVTKKFIGMLGRNTAAAADKMVQEAERQLAIPGVMEGKVLPDYDKAIEIAADNALKYMLTPSILCMLSPIVLGFPFGPEIVFGLLIGMACTAIGEAIFNGNAGGARDNAKKRIEMGEVEGIEKGSEGHIAAVANDTVGDTEKDVIGVCCDIAMKLASTVANSMVSMFEQFRLFNI